MADKLTALVGLRARVSGLQARPDLNGKVVVVLEPKDASEADQLRAKGRVRVTAFPKCMHVNQGRKPYDSRGQVPRARLDLH